MLQLVGRSHMTAIPDSSIALQAIYVVLQSDLSHERLSYAC